MRKTTLSLVSTAAALLFVGMSSAQAADAIVAAPPEAPGNYVQVCDAFGTGYFFIPGSETCLKLSGNVTVSGGYDSFRDAGFSSVEARMDIDTRADSEIGTIGTKIRLSSKGNLDNFTLGGLDSRDEGVELAYITAGPVFAGYKETLVDTNILYGDSLDLETYFGGLNTTTVGVLVDNLGGGFYAGLAVENREREGGLNTVWYDDGNSPDIAARAGIAGQAWGKADISGLYSTETEDWFVKGTADVKAGEKADFRLAAGYGDTNGDNYYLLAAAGKYAFTDKVSAFTGVSYFDADNANEIWTANLGAIYSIATNFDVKGEAYYSDWQSDDTFGTKVTFVRSW
jgi:Porin subfamily.